MAVLREPTVAGIGQLAAMQTAAPSFEVELQPIDARDVAWSYDIDVRLVRPDPGRARPSEADG